VADELERWLAVAENRGEWERLRRALQLESGFALFVVDVPDVETEGRVVELLARERAELVVLDGRSSGEQAPVRELLRTRERVVALRSVEASRWDVEALERCLVQFNARRDRLAVRGHVLVIVLRRDAVARMIDVAPDLYSVHRSRFRFARLVKPRPVPLWLLTDVEFAAVLDEDGRSFRERMAFYDKLFWDTSEPFAWANALGLWDNAAPPQELVAARIFARWEGLRCIGEPRDLASALASPSLDVELLLRDSLRAAQSEGSFLTYLCATALAWMYLQASKLAEGRWMLDGPSQDWLPAHRSKLMALHLAASEGSLTTALLAEAISESWLGFDLAAKIAVRLDVTAIECEFFPSSSTVSRLRRVLTDIEHSNLNRWRFDSALRSLPSELLAEAAPKYQRDEAMTWLRERLLAKDLNWDPAWTTYLMIERALDHAANVAEFVSLGREWLDTPARHRSYEVWHPLVDIHAETQDTAALDELIRMPLAVDAGERLGPKLDAALQVVADVLDRGLLEISATERDALRARATARDGLPLDLRLGWWAIELALADA
jgi:hypothetical protein